MSNKRYPEEFKIEAVKQVTDRGYSVADVAKRLELTHLEGWDFESRLVSDDKNLVIPAKAGIQALTF